MHSVSLIQLIVSLAVSIVLLVVGISGLMKNNISVMNVSQSQVKTTEWLFIALGVLLLIFSIWSYVVCGDKHFDDYF